MGIAINKGLALRYATSTVADELNSCLDFAQYDRFNNCYNESKETHIEWLEALLKKLTVISHGTYPMIGYLSHVGRLLKEFSEERWGYGCGFARSQMAYALFMEYFVADGYMAEHGIADPIADPIVDANASVRSGV